MPDIDLKMASLLRGRGYFYVRYNGGVLQAAKPVKAIKVSAEWEDVRVDSDTHPQTKITLYDGQVVELDSLC